MNHLTVDQFLERIAEMPDIEAEQEIVLRKEHAALEVAMLQRELAREKARAGAKSAAVIQIGHALQVCAQDNTRLNASLKDVRARMERLSWGNAVRAVFGSEGYEACRVWMEANRVTPC